MHHTVDVWTSATIIIYVAIGVDAILASRTLSWGGSAKKLLLSFVAIFWLGAASGYVPLIVPGWPGWLEEVTRKTLPVAALFFLVGGGFRKIAADLRRTGGSPLPEWYYDFIEKLDRVRPASRKDD